MTSVKILTKSEQKQTIKGIHKPKKNIIKNYLESPFALEWPQLTLVDEEEIIAIVQKSCSGLRKLECKPPWKQVSKYKGANRRSFLEECNKKFQDNLDPDGIKQMNKRKEALSHLIFGYNAVMRALEKDCVAGILVKKNVEPIFVTRTFLPGCAKKCIPLVPLNDLDIILKDKETLSLPHACMVLGVKPSVKQKSNRFHSLYTKMCKVLSVDEVNENDREDVESRKSTGDESDSESSKCSYRLSKTDIEAFHLNRNSNGRRAFVPSAHEMQTDDLKFCVDFIGFKSLETQHSTHGVHDADSEKTEGKSINIKGVAAVDENIDFSSMILIDASGEENLSTESGSLKGRTAGEEKLTPKHSHKAKLKVRNKDSHKAKRKAKEIDHDDYAPAKTKRLKGNPNRKAKDK
ncbi:hypothetical protein GWK47_022636 [Chionoecetes opilio]|uniref:Uncharacterized protein n=1 Tax=Chionoecetes opilio TaxID=41210 RepID=A0A8J5CK31_CHIOP|nr:hypothetical protein GWK47_022636 [Chionoecetes opilio]